MQNNLKAFDYRAWKSEVNVVLKKIYSIDIEMAGIDDDYLKVHFEMKESPSEFVKRFGDKYDLTQ